MENKMNDISIDNMYSASSNMILLNENSSETYNIIYDLDQHICNITEQYSRINLNLNFSGIDANILRFLHRKVNFTGFMEASIALYNGKSITAKSYQFDNIMHALDHFLNLKNADNLIFVYRLIFNPQFYTENFINPSTFENVLIDEPKITPDKPYWKIQFATISPKELMQV